MNNNNNENESGDELKNIGIGYRKLMGLFQGGGVHGFKSNLNNVQ